MADFHKLQKDGKTVWPATVTTAVIDPDTRVILQDSITSWSISRLWPTENVHDITSAIAALSNHIPVEKQIPGTRVEFKNADGKNEEWEFVGGNGVAWSDLNGWRECGGNVISELLNEVFPLTTTFTATPTVIPVGSGTEVSMGWSTTRNGADITSLCSYTLDDNAVSGTSKKETLTPSTASTITKTLVAEYRGDSRPVTVTITAIQPTYYGPISATGNVDVATVSALSNRLQSSKSTTLSSLDYTNQRYVYAYPKSLGDLGSIKDGNGFEYITSGFTKTELTLNGVAYNVYTLSSPATVTNFKYIFA